MRQTRVLEVEAVPTNETRPLIRAAIMTHISQQHIDDVLAAQEADCRTLARWAAELPE